MQHCGLIEQNIRFLKKKIRSLHHSLPFERVPGIMVVRMVLHIVKFVNGFQRKGGMKHYSPGDIITNQCLHADDLRLGFGTYCQEVAEMLSQETVLPHAHELRSCLATWEIFQAARYSLLWILATPLLSTNGWHSRCHLQLLPE